MALCEFPTRPLNDVLDALEKATGVRVIDGFKKTDQPVTKEDERILYKAAFVVCLEQGREDLIHYGDQEVLSTDAIAQILTVVAHEKIEGPKPLLPLTSHWEECANHRVALFGAWNDFVSEVQTIHKRTHGAKFTGCIFHETDPAEKPV